MITDPNSIHPVRLTLSETPDSRKSDEAFVDSFDTSRVTTSPGCYIMRDKNDKVVYVGKAKNLRNRIRTYINDQDSRYSVKFLMKRVAHIDFLVTHNEKEALLLENSLIKQFKPRYNIQLKDDKTYVSIRINKKEDFPKITVVRKYRKDGALYFGPYSSAGAVRETIKQIQRLFPLRTCSDHVLNNRSRPCIYYQMKRCNAPCVDYVDRGAYHEVVDEAVMVLKGQSRELENVLKEKIVEKSEALAFEDAAEIRDRLYALQKTLEKQRAVDITGKGDRDVFGLYTENRFTEIQIIFYRNGKMLGGRSFSYKKSEMPVEEMLSSFLLQFYSDAPVIPAEVLIPIALDEASVMAEILTEQRGAKVQVLSPQRGDKKALLDTAERNAKLSFHEKRMAEQAQTDLVEQVKEKLKLETLPNRIECFDISTHQGDKTVGSMVVFEGATANKNRYRRYSIKEVEGQDDFASMREVLMRRYKRAIEENDLPDMVLIDGGKGQLGVATAVFRDLGIEDLECIGIAKSRSQEEGGRSPERFFTPGRSNPIVLAQNSNVVHLLARIRDEAHRFAITYHRKRKSKGVIRTSLTDIPGVGPTLAKKLLKHFGSVTAIRESSPEEISEIPGINRSLSSTIWDQLNKKAAEVS
jgi:excinuclease ABC subunit C